jgi:hypothetical protein
MNLKDDDYTLEEGAAWFTVKGFAIRIQSTDEGVAVDVWKDGGEMDSPIASTYAYDQDIATDETRSYGPQGETA